MTIDNPLLALLATNPHPLLQPTSEYNAAALSLAKLYLDPLALSISEIQAERQKENRKKRKRGEREDAAARPLQLKRLHVEGFKVDQVHEQVRRVLDAAAKEVKLGLQSLASNGTRETNGPNGAKAVRFEDGESEDEDLLEEDGFHTDEGSDPDDEEISSEADVDGAEDLDENEEDIEGLSEAEEDIEGSEEYSSDDGQGQADLFVQDRHGLNDGFFSIDDFNRQTDFLEQVDARGDGDDGAASDEEDVDWTADPLTMDLSQTDQPRIRSSEADESDEDDDDEGGPTFGDMDLNAPEGFSDQEDDVEDDADVDMAGLDDSSNANNIRYRDFFAPPARRASDKRGGRRGPPMKHNFPARATNEDAEEDVSRIMDAARRDLFSDEEEVEEEDDLSEVDEFDPKARRSNHERRQAKILEEIRKLEADNVAKREWTMSGEARALDRPHNSLLEQDLDFERVGKPVPVITQEVTEDIEALIKRRILAREFDEVLRRQPDELLTGPLGRRGRIEEEIQDSKSKQGLAELYEEDHLRRTDPNYVDARDEKLKAAHREIENLWKDVADKLDSLSSWHYRPKPVEMSVQVRTDAPIISMEDARPSGIGGEVGETSQLAPQEIYKAGQDKSKSEIVTKGGEVVARDELSREQKKSRRARQKERAKKAGENVNKPANGAAPGPKKERTRSKKNELVGDLKKGGVMVIGRKGEVVDVEGKEVKGKKALSAGSLRL